MEKYNRRDSQDLYNVYYPKYTRLSFSFFEARTTLHEFKNPGKVSKYHKAGRKRLYYSDCLANTEMRLYFFIYKEVS